MNSKIGKDVQAKASKRWSPSCSRVKTAVSAEGPKSRSVAAKSKSGREVGTVTTGNKAMAVRLSGIEEAGFELLKERLGYRSNSEALRGLVRMALGLLEFEPTAAGELTALKTELQKIGVNVNQIAMAANRGRVDMLPPDWEALNDLRRIVPRLRMTVDDVVLEQRRRGTMLFKEWQASNG